MIEVRPDWWKSYFDRVYLLSDARSVLNEAVTRREIDWLQKVARPRKTDRILDLCGGQGRHALEMSRRGFRNVAVLDYSPYLIRLGKRQAKILKRPVRFIRGDARSTPLTAGSFDVVMLMANSFGYFADDAQNRRILAEARRVLNPGGKLFLDLTDRNKILKSLRPLSWHETPERLTVCRRREIEGGVIRVREIVVSAQKGLLRDGRYQIRVFTRPEIAGMLRRTNMRLRAVRYGAPARKRGDYGFLNSRLAVLAVKP